MRQFLCVPMIYLLSKNKKKINFFQIIFFTAVKKQSILHRHVILMMFVIGCVFHRVITVLPVLLPLTARTLMVNYDL